MHEISIHKTLYAAYKCTSMNSVSGSVFIIEYTQTLLEPEVTEIAALLKPPESCWAGSHQDWMRWSHLRARHSQNVC